VYGVSFLLVWSSVSLLNAASVITRRPQMRSTWIAEIALPMLALGTVFAFGFHQLRAAEVPAREIRIALIQPSVPQTLIWNPDGDMQRFQKLLQLSEQALTNNVDLLIWPEAAVPGYPRFQADIADPISALARSNHVWMIIGADDGEVTATATNFYNASFLISPEGRIAAGYRKRSLVIFGEYIPLERWLPFIKWFTPVTGSYTSGDKAVPYEMELADNQSTDGSEHSMEIHSADSGLPARSDDSRRAKTSVLICYEDNFPHLVREYVEDDTDFLVNITNNGWFGESAAQWQHAANAIFRAIENGIPLVRCSNNGLTCWVDAQGRIREIFHDQSGTIYGQGYMTTRVPLLASGERRVQTFYNRHGDWFGWSCAAISGLALLRAKLGRKAPCALKAQINDSPG
jgi:apolipoprotein N-acyltransferase